MKTKIPSTLSSCDTARVVSRKMRKAGFVMSKKIDKWSRSSGFIVKRLGCSSTIYVDYHSMAWIHNFSSEKLKSELQINRENLSKAIEFLRSEKYLIDDNGYIKCEYSW